MSERKTRRKIETQTAQSLQPAPPMEKDDPIQKLLGVIYAQGMEGNMTAAKVYLDFSLKQPGEDPGGLTPEQALAILREHTP